VFGGGCRGGWERPAISDKPSKPPLLEERSWTSTCVSEKRELLSTSRKRGAVSYRRSWVQSKGLVWETSPKHKTNLKDQRGDKKQKKSAPYILRSR